ncbi:MAG: hypothetical protein AAGA48_21560 [Myxococcota bacterium]
MSLRSRIGLGIVWAILLAYAVLFAPPSRPDQDAWVMRLLTGEWEGEEPWVVVIFNLLGVWPLVMASLLAPWLRRRPIGLWPFVAGSMALGAFILIPGLVIGGKPQPVATWQRFLRHPAFRGALALGTMAMVAGAIALGDPEEYARIFARDQFVHVMSLDFAVLYLTSVVVAREQGGSWGWALLPLLGGLLVARPLDE